MKQPRTIYEAFAQIADCNLATVSHMAELRSKQPGEYRRQIAIAQMMIDWMEEFHVEPAGTRAEEIITLTTVAEWAAQYEPKPRKAKALTP